jgi:hypothetical protein
MIVESHAHIFQDGATSPRGLASRELHHRYIQKSSVPERKAPSRRPTTLTDRRLHLYMSDFVALAQAQHPDRFTGRVRVDAPEADAPHWMAEAQRAVRVGSCATPYPRSFVRSAVRRSRMRRSAAA